VPAPAAWGTVTGAVFRAITPARTARRLHRG